MEKIWKKFGTLFFTMWNNIKWYPTNFQKRWVKSYRYLGVRRNQTDSANCRELLECMMAVNGPSCLQNSHSEFRVKISILAPEQPKGCGSLQTTQNFCSKRKCLILKLRIKNRVLTFLTNSSAQKVSRNYTLRNFKSQVDGFLNFRSFNKLLNNADYINNIWYLARFCNNYLG